jgi:hypothetical protein
MEFIKQTKYGKEGNCLEACISSLTGISLESFPDLTEIESVNGEWWKILNNWLRKKHKLFIDSVIFDFENANEFERGLMIAVGDSPNLEGELHATIWDMDNNEMIFDPSPSNEGIKGDPHSFCMIINYYNKKP